MLLMRRLDQRLIAVDDIQCLSNPYKGQIVGRLQWGEEEQDSEIFDKADVCFLSGEGMPLCWCDEHYRDALPVNPLTLQPSLTSDRFPYYGS